MKTKLRWHYFKIKLCAIYTQRNDGVVGVPYYDPEISSVREAVSKRKVQFIGRTCELEILKKAVDPATRKAKVILLSGEAGIGKTRLANELGKYAQLNGMKILNGACPAPFGTSNIPPYAVWKEIIRNYLHTASPQQLHTAMCKYQSSISKLVPETRQRTESLEAPRLRPDHERDRLFEAVWQFLTNVSRTTPLLIVLDDLQWADSSSLLLLKYLARGISEESLFILGVYCDTETENRRPSLKFLTEFKRETLLQSIELKRMTKEQTLEIIEQVTRQGDVQKEFCDLVYERTKGNPLHVEEVITMLKEEGVIHCEENTCKIREAAEVELPDNPRDVLKRRLRKLDEECFNVLTLASFIGNEFTLEALEKIMGIEEKRLIEIAKKMLGKGILKCANEYERDRYSFVSVLYRDILYEEVSPLKRKKTHGIVGSALEKLFAKKVEPHFGELASHYLESGDKEKALPYLMKAGEEAEGVYANTEAAWYYESALKLEEKEDNIRENARVLEALGRAKHNNGDHEACQESWKEAALLWEQLGEKENVAKLYRKISHELCKDKNDIKKAGEYLEKAMAILVAQPEGPELAGLYIDKAEFRCSSEPTTSTDQIRRALQIAEKLNAHEEIAQSYMVLGRIIGKQKPSESIDCFEKALKVALDNGCTEAALEAYVTLENQYAETGEKEKRLMIAQEGYDYAKKVGAIVAQSTIGTNLSSMLIDTGDIDTAFAIARESESLNRKIGNQHRLALSLLNLGRIHLVWGQWDKSEEYFQKALKIAQESNDTLATNPTSLYVGHLNFERGEYAKVRELIERTGAKLWQKTFLPLVVSASIELEDLEKAEYQIGGLQQLAQDLKDPQLIARTDEVRGRFFLAQKKFNESIEHFERSLKEYEALGARRWDVYAFAKRILFSYAEAYLERNKEGDREKAFNLFNQALELFQKMNAKKDAEKTKAKIAYIQTGQMLPSEPAAPVATGYATLDKLLFGGFPANSAIALTSPSCDERDAIIKSFLETGAKNREITFYLTIDPTLAGSLPREFTSTFFLFVCNTQGEAIVKSKPNVSILKGVESLTNINIALTTAMRKLGPSRKGTKRICIGLASDVLLQHGPIQARKWFAELLTQLKSFDFTTLAIVNSQMHPAEQLHAVLSLFEGEIGVREAETAQGLTRFLRINRMSNHRYQKDETPLLGE